MELRMQNFAKIVYLAFFTLLCITLTLSRPESGSIQGTPAPLHVHRGVIKEDALEGEEVILDEPLQSRNLLNVKDICGYTIYNGGLEFPFKIILLDQTTGSAKIVLDKGFELDHEKKKEYSFDISAHDCRSDDIAERERVEIRVDDVNEHAPEWIKDHYYIEAIEGRIYERLVRLEAKDKDGDGKICGYRVLTPDVPFEVDADGYLRNTEQLDYGTRHNYIVEVTAEDCDGQKSGKALVNVIVKTTCKSSWTGVPSQIDFALKETTKVIAPNADLKLCEDAGCEVSQIVVKIDLKTNNLGKGCGRDTYSMQSQRKLCGASEETIDLLPDPSKDPANARNFSADGTEESDEIFAFDGKNTAIEVPSHKIRPYLGQQFTISTWMKHDDDVATRDSKEHVLCNADGEDMNRHHYSLFIHNCHLILLIREEPEEGVDLDKFRPAEWRWKIAEVCDGKWHHYTISVDFPQVRLYLDGVQFISNKHNPEVMDDWPLHPAKHVHFTKLVVGACWQGGKHRMGQYFRGYLAGLSILKNKTEADSVIQCLNNCHEKLDFGGVNDMDTGMSVSMNNEMTNLNISGVSLESMKKFLHKVSYINTRAYPTVGRRPLIIETHAVCSDGKHLPIETVSSEVVISEAEKVSIVLTADLSLQRNEENLVYGEKIFHNLRIAAQTDSEDSKFNLSKTVESSTDAFEYGEKYKLDSCMIRVDPPLNLNLEHLRYSENILSRLSLEADVSEDGLVIAGVGKIADFEELLTEVKYVNSHPEELNSRTFVLSCTELVGHLVSNQLEVTIQVVHLHQSAPPQAVFVHKEVESQHNIILQGKPSEHEKSENRPVAGIVVICIVCVGFVAAVVILGVMRIQNAKRHRRDMGMDDKQEMEWDNSELTITVNPMDQETLFDEEVRGGPSSLHGDETDSDEDNSFHDEEPDESSEETEPMTAEKVKSRELEWDDSVLSI